MRSSQYKHLYHTERWKQMSKRFRVIHPVCAMCGEPAQVVDHIKPHKGNVGLFFKVDNLMSLCKRCHDSDKAKIENGKVPGKDFVINNKAGQDGMPLAPTHPWNKK